VRYINLETGGKKIKFLQLNVVFQSEQKLRVLRAGKPIGGHDEFKPVTDYLVVEKSLDDVRVAPHWRFIARIDPSKTEQSTVITESMLSE